jgi:hypothetical protein
MERDLDTMKSALTVSQRVAICFAAGVIGAVAVVLFSHVLFQLGLSATLGVEAPASLKSPDIYKPLFWGGLWGALFGLFIKTAWNRLYLVGFLYVLAPLLALFLFFLPMGGAGYFGLHRGADVYSLSSAGESAVRDSHRLGRQRHHRKEALGIVGGSMATVTYGRGG